MLWITIRHSLPVDGRIARIAKLCNVHSRQALGSFVALLIAADMVADDAGRVPGWDAQAVDDIAGLQGMANALVAVGWLRLTDSGAVMVNWQDWNSKSTKKRLADAEKTRKYRERKEIKTGRAEPVTTHGNRIPETCYHEREPHNNTEQSVVVAGGSAGLAVAAPPPQAASAGDGRRDARLRALASAGLDYGVVPDLRDAEDLPSSKVSEIAEAVRRNGGQTGAIVRKLRAWLKDHRTKPKPAAVPRPEPKPEPEPELPPLDLSAIPPADLERLADGYRATFSQHRAKPTAEIVVLPRFATWVGAQLEKQNA